MNKYVNCAVFCHGAFWYEICGQVNLNGQYGLMALEKPYVESDGFYWNLYFDVEDDGWDGFLSASEMKFREQ